MFRRPSEADADAWRREQPLTVVAGTVPEGICGTYYKNGPVWSGADDEHPLDGEGFVWALRFRGDGRVTFRAAAVETDHVLAERRQGGRRLRPGAFGGAGAGGAGAAGGASVKNVANTNVVPWGDDLLAFYEAGAPYVLDPDTLRTEGRFLSFRDGLPVTSGNGAVDATMRLLGKWGDAVSAHPKVVAAAAVGDDDAARLVLATLKYSLTRGANARTDVTFTEIDASGAIVQQRTVTVGGFAYFHDFAVTESRYIFFQAPLTIDWDAVGARGIAQSMRQLGGEPTQIHSVARATGAHTVVPFGGGVGVGGGGGGSFVFHHAYARDAPALPGAGATRTVIASVHYPEYAVPGEVGAAGTAIRGELRELTVDWREGGVTAVRQMARGGWLEFPVYDAAGARVFATAEWTPGGGPQQAIVSVETAAAGAPAHYWTRAGCFFGEPFLIGTEWVAAPCRRVEGAEGAAGAAMLLLIWHADRLVEGPIAEIALPPGVPMGLHGTWMGGSGGGGECFGADSDAE